ncbi:MAG TPA: GYF domain-containing protein [Tepidisphaeraceae bacterium]|jgi:hypothetical protein|nr:GYF domain-containing protein [Tepidisphaeraceae bacterium]
MWYYAKGNQQFGPVGAEVVRGMLAAGTLAGTDLVWTNGMAEWKEARSVEELRVEQQGNPPPVPPIPPVNPPPPPGWDWGYGSGTYKPPAAGTSQHGKSVAALVCSIVGVVCSPAGVGLAAGIVAIVLASSATNHMARSGNYEGRGLAKAGFVIGIVAVCLSMTVHGARFRF